MRSDHASPGPAKRRKDLAFGLAVLLAVLILGWVVVTMQHLATNLAASNAARDALARQVQELGAKPIAGPPGSRGAPGPAVTGAKGDQGDQGDQGLPGADSTVPGPTGPPGKTGANSTVPGPVGPTGPAGLPGADSTVPGPQGPQGDPGPAGAAGQDGKDGTNGRDGTNGQPPAGWTYAWTDAAGTTHQVACTRTADSPDSAPQYTCQDTTPTPTPTASASASPAAPANRNLFGAVALASTAMYRKL